MYSVTHKEKVCLKTHIVGIIIHINVCIHIIVCINKYNCK